MATDYLPMPVIQFDEETQKKLDELKAKQIPKAQEAISAYAKARARMAAFEDERKREQLTYKEAAQQRLATNKMAALAYVNRVREELRLGTISELEKGSISEPSSCVIAESVKDFGVFASVTPRGAHYHRVRWGFRHYGHHDHSMPAEVTQFIVDFDNGRYPELVKK